MVRSDNTWNAGRLGLTEGQGFHSRNRHHLRENCMYCGIRTIGDKCTAESPDIMVNPGHWVSKELSRTAADSASTRWYVEVCRIGAATRGRESDTIPSIRATIPHRRRVWRHFRTIRT